MQHLDTYSSCVDALCCISGIAKCPLSKHDNCVTVSYYTIIENREIDGGGFFASTLFNIFLYTDTLLCIITSITYKPFCEWIALGCLRQHLKISTEVIKPCELRITLLPTHGAAWTWRSFLQSECVGGCSGRARVGMPVCWQEGGAEFTHVFTYVDRWVCFIEQICMLFSGGCISIWLKKAGKSPCLLHNVLEMCTWQMQAALFSDSLLSAYLMPLRTLYHRLVLLCKSLMGKSLRQWLLHYLRL